MVPLEKKGHLCPRGATLWMNIEKWIKMPPEVDCSIHGDSLPRSSFKHRLAALMQLLQSADRLQMPDLFGYHSIAGAALFWGSQWLREVRICKPSHFSLLQDTWIGDTQCRAPHQISHDIEGPALQWNFSSVQSCFTHFPSQAWIPNKAFVP